MRLRKALALLAGLFLVSCGGGGSSAVAPGTASASKTQSVQGNKMVLEIPTGQSGSSKVRYPQFVSPSASSVSIVINGGTAQLFDVSATSSLCTTTSGTRSCTLTFGAPVGSDTITVTIYAGANGTGTVLATATQTQNVASGTPFNVAVAMNATIGTIVVNVVGNNNGNCNQGTSSSNSILEGCAGSGTLTITAFDPSGAQITGSAPYATPIQITANDPSFSASPNPVTGPGQTVTGSYNGAALGSSITNAITVTLTVGAQAITTSIPAVRQYLYVANSNAPPGTTPPGGGNIAVYMYGSSGSATPTRLISGGSTQLSNPVVPVLDSSGNLYVLDNGPYTTHSNPLILVFASGATGNVAPTRTITGLSTLSGNNACNGMTFDPSGTYLLLTCGDSFTNGVHVIQASTNGTYVQTANFPCSGSCFSFTIGLAFSPVGDLYVAETGLNDVFEFAKGTFSFTGGTQMLTPARTLNGSSGTPWPTNVSPLAIVFDSTSTMYVDSVYSNSTSGAADANNRVSIWNSSVVACNNCAPSFTLTGTPFTTHAPTGIILDGGGNLYVGNQFNNTISVFAKSTLGSSATNPTVLRTLSTGSSPGAPTGLAVGP